MNALSLLEPWASLVVLGAKKFETRSWRPAEKHWGRTIAIHASKSMEAIKDGTAAELFKIAGLELPKKWDLGCIIGQAILIGAKETEIVEPRLSAKERAFGNYLPGRWGWLLRRPIWFPNPVPCRGMLGLWEIPRSVSIQFLGHES